MDQTQRRKDQFYRVKAKVDGLEKEVEKWRAVVDVAEGELKSAAAEILALKAEVERMKAEIQALNGSCNYRGCRVSDALEEFNRGIS